MRVNPEQKHVEMYQKNIRLVTFIACKFKHKVPEQFFDDVIAEGRIGLWRACLYFKEDKGVQFSTYAGYSISQACSNYIRKYVYKQDNQNISINSEITDTENGLEYGDTLESEPDYYFIPDIINKVKNDKMLLLYSQGYNQRQIGKMLGISQAHTSRLMKKAMNELKKYVV